MIFHAMLTKQRHAELWAMLIQLCCVTRLCCWAWFLASSILSVSSAFSWSCILACCCRRWVALHRWITCRADSQDMNCSKGKLHQMLFLFYFFQSWRNSKYRLLFSHNDLVTLIAGMRGSITPVYLSLLVLELQQLSVPVLVLLHLLQALPRQVQHGLLPQGWPPSVPGPHLDKQYRYNLNKIILLLRALLRVTVHLSQCPALWLSFNHRGRIPWGRLDGRIGPSLHWGRRFYEGTTPGPSPQRACPGQ